MKFGIIIPNTVQDAIDLDVANGNTYWQDTIKKEMENCKIAFKPLE